MSVHVDEMVSTVEAIPAAEPAPPATPPQGLEAVRAQRDALQRAAVDAERTRSEGYSD